MKQSLFRRQTDALSEELKHLRKECRSQARKLEDMHHALAARDGDEDELRSKVRRQKCSASHVCVYASFSTPGAPRARFPAKRRRQLVGGSTDSAGILPVIQPMPRYQYWRKHHVHLSNVRSVHSQLQHSLLHGQSCTNCEN